MTGRNSRGRIEGWKKIKENKSEDIFPEVLMKASKLETSQKAMADILAENFDAHIKDIRKVLVLIKDTNPEHARYQW